MALYRNVLGCLYSISPLSMPLAAASFQITAQTVLCSKGVSATTARSSVSFHETAMFSSDILVLTVLS